MIISEIDKNKKNTIDLENKIISDGIGITSKDWSVLFCSSWLKNLTIAIDPAKITDDHIMPAPKFWFINELFSKVSEKIVIINNPNRHIVINVSLVCNSILISFLMSIDNTLNQLSILKVL